MTAGIHTFTESGKMRKATYTEVCEWVSEAWNAVPVTAITNGFRKAGIDGIDHESDDSLDDDDDDVERRHQTYLQMSQRFSIVTVKDEDFDRFQFKLIDI